MLRGIVADLVMVHSFLRLFCLTRLSRDQSLNSNSEHSMATLEYGSVAFANAAFRQCNESKMFWQQICGEQP